MGQKVNPISFRLGINRTWDSRWYADSEYGDLLHEDLRIRRFLFKRLDQAGVAKVVIERPAKKARITIHTARPGVVIGKKGADIEKLKAEIAKMAETVLRDDYVVSNPVTAAMSSYELRASGDEKDRVLADLATENAGLRRDYRDMSTRVGHLETEARRNFPSTAFDIAKIIGNDPSSGFKFAIPGEIFKVPEFNLKVSDWLTGTGGVKTEEDDEGEDGK